MALILNNPNNQVQSNLISVRPSDATQTDMEFAHFMRLAESWLNDASEADRQLFRKCNGTEMEHIALKALKDVAPQTSALTISNLFRGYTSQTYKLQVILELK